MHLVQKTSYCVRDVYFRTMTQEIDDHIYNADSFDTQIWGKSFTLQRNTLGGIVKEPHKAPA